MTENKHFIRNELKKLMARSCFVALTAMAVVMWSPVGVRDNLKDIWNSPERLTAIENDVDEINEMLSVAKLDDNRIITSVSP